MTLSEIRAQFITAKAELLKLQDMIDMSYESDDVLEETKDLLESVVAEMDYVKQAITSVVKSHDNNFHPLPEADEE